MAGLIGGNQGGSRARTLEIGLFLLTGGFAALVNIVSRYILTPQLGYGTSVVVAYLIGMVIAFCLFRSFVFGRSGHGAKKETYRFVVVNVVALVVVWALSTFLAGVLLPRLGVTSYAEDIGHMIAVCVPAITSYLGHSRYTFKADDAKSKARTEG